MIISLYSEKSLWQNTVPLHVKILRTVRHGTYLNIIKAIYIKSAAYIKLNGKQLEAIPLK